MGTAQAKKAADKCRAVADVLDGLDLPDNINIVIGQGPTLALFCYKTDQLRCLRRQLGPMAKGKSAGGYGYMLRGSVDGVPVDLWPPSDACRRVEVGTEEREVADVPDEVASQYMRTEVVPVYEWECDPVLADDVEVPA